MKILVLNATNQSITVAMGGAAATTNPDVVVTYADSTSSAFTEAPQTSALNGTTPVTIVSSPAASTRRVIAGLNIFNRDTAAVTIDVNFVDGANTRRIWHGVLQPNETKTLDGVFDANGALKTTASSIAASLLTGQVALANGGTGVDNTSRTANTVFSGPTSGGAANASFRALVAADVPNLPGSIITSGTVAAARLGSGTPSDHTILFGDGTWKPGGKVLWLTKTALASNTNNINISSGQLPTYGTYYNLHIRYTTRTDKAAALENTRLQFNSDTGSNYLSVFGYNAGATTGPTGSGSVTAAGVLIPVSAVANTGLANTFGYIEVIIPLWGETGRNHECDIIGGISSGTALADLWQFHTHGTWRNTADPITSIKLVPDTGTNFVTGSTVEMWAE